MSREGEVAKLTDLLERVRRNAQVSRDPARRSGVSWSGGAPDPSRVEPTAAEEAEDVVVALIAREPAVPEPAAPAVPELAAPAFVAPVLVPPPEPELAEPSAREGETIERTPSPSSADDVEVEIDMSGSEPPPADELQAPAASSFEAAPMAFATEPAPPPVEALPTVILSPDAVPSSPREATLPPPPPEQPEQPPARLVALETARPSPPEWAPEPLPPVPTTPPPALDLNLTPGPSLVAPLPAASSRPAPPAPPLQLDVPERTVQPARVESVVAEFVGHPKSSQPATFGDILDVTIALGD